MLDEFSAFKAVIALFFISGIIGVLVRFTGAFTCIGFLRDTLPIKAANLGVGIAIICFTILFGFRRNIFAGVYLFCFGILTSITVIHLAMSPPAAPDAWNTIPFELLRSLCLGLYMFGLFSLTMRVQLPHKKITYWVLYSCASLVLFAILQGANLLPNFFFQWFGSAHIPRPTGGMDHPHFLALLLVQASCIALISYEKMGISKRMTGIFLGVFAIGILVSTSRVGFIAEVVFMSVYACLRLDFTRLTIIAICLMFSLILFGLWVAINWSLVSELPIVHTVTVFLSAFQESFGSEDGRFLRGRGDLWGHELDLIAASPETLLFGYGNQPFVSHNLVLRQLQVSGILGTICYLVMLLSSMIYWVSNVEKQNRAPIYALLIAFGIGSLTFPVFISVPIVCGIIVSAALSISKNSARLHV